jgi:hypothetical protein
LKAEKDRLPGWQSICAFKTFEVFFVSSENSAFLKDHMRLSGHFRENNECMMYVTDLELNFDDFGHR